MAVCIKAYANKSTSVKNTVLAVLRQQYSILFNQFVSLAKNSGAEDSKTYEETDVYKVCAEQIVELVSLAGDKYKQISYKAMGMDILTVIFAETGAYLKNVKVIKETIVNHLVPHLKSYMEDPSTSYSLLSRTIKLSTQIFLNFSISHNLLFTILTFATSGQSWIRYLALEVFCSLLHNSSLLQTLHSIPNTETYSNVNIYIDNILQDA